VRPATNSISRTCYCHWFHVRWQEVLLGVVEQLVEPSVTLMVPCRARVSPAPNEAQTKKLVVRT
jgi:hypothetical protein